jgi:hypothetical protein
MPRWQASRSRPFGESLAMAMAGVRFGLRMQSPFPRSIATLKGGLSQRIDERPSPRSFCAGPSESGVGVPTGAFENKLRPSGAQFQSGANFD